MFIHVKLELYRRMQHSTVERFSQEVHPVPGTSFLKSDLLPCVFFLVLQQVS